MAAAIWAIAYAIDANDREAYLGWFHDVHIPEKLARPGYAWAGHYASLDGGARFLALFGSAEARTFLDPTPGQLKGRQDALTRERMGMRRNGGAAVLAEVAREGSIVVPSVIRYSMPAEVDADAAAAWVVQERLPALRKSASLLWTALCVPVIGAGRLALLEGYASESGMPSRSGAAFDRDAFEGRRIDPA